AHGGAERGPTRVRVLDHDRRGLVELEQERKCRREIEEVVVAELGPVQRLHRRQPERRGADEPIERRRLMRVLAVLERQRTLPLEAEQRRIFVVSRAGFAGTLLGPPCEERRNRGVVLRGPSKRVCGEARARLVTQLTIG